jgi:predicted ABC-type ATPase
MTFMVTGTFEGQPVTVGWDNGIFTGPERVLMFLEEMELLDQPLPLTPEGPFLEPDADDPQAALLMIAETLTEIEELTGDIPWFLEETEQEPESEGVLYAARWTPAKHPRYPKRHPKGGQFRPKAGGAPGVPRGRRRGEGADWTKRNPLFQSFSTRRLQEIARGKDRRAREAREELKVREETDLEVAPSRALRLDPSLLREIEERGFDKWPSHGEVTQRLLTDEEGTLHKDTQSLHSRSELVNVGVQEEIHVRVEQRRQRVYTPERERVHREIIDRYLRGVSPVVADERPRMIFLAGGTASGKTTSKDRLEAEGLLPASYVNVNPDDIKEELEEYREAAAAGDLYATSAVHEESSDIAKRIQAEAIRRRMHVLVDGTGDAEGPKMTIERGGAGVGREPFGKFHRKLNDARGRGYDVEVVVSDVETPLAVARMIERFKRTRRFVPIGTLRQIHRDVARRHLQWRDDPNIGWRAYSNDERPPRLLAEKAPGGEIVVHDEARYTAFQDKAQEDITAPLVAA